MRDIQWLYDVCNTSSGPYLRPFAPNPKWQHAEVFVVGTNPATPLRDELGDFSAYWHALTQDSTAFDRVYSAKHRPGASKSTLRARGFLRHLAPLNTLVTNALVYPAKRPSEIPSKREQRRLGADVFDFLYRTCMPKSILFHGVEAIGLGTRYFGSALDPYVPATEQAVRSADGTHLFAFPHFSGQGVRPGYAVREMDNELRRMADRIHRIVEVA